MLVLSLKFINILRDLYSHASTCIQTSEGLTESARVTQGVLQEKVLSPFLFLLFISELGNFFIKQECRGLAIDSSFEVLMLEYADD